MTLTLRLLSTATLWSLASVAAAAGEQVPPCDSCAAWNETQAPFRLYGNSYYVGPRGLGSILITSDKGHVLIDGALPESAPKIAANVRSLGFRVEDIKVILNSHVHFDHAGGIAELQRMSGAEVWASPASARVLEHGGVGRDDPQFGLIQPIARVSSVSVLKDGGVVRVGALDVTAHFTPGHTPGGTSWSWKSCEAQRCLDMVYADSLTPVSAPDFKFTNNQSYPGVLKDFQKSYATLTALPCDILVSTHPAVTGLWERLEKRESQKTVTDLSIRPRDMYVEASRERLRKRLEEESAH
jgi:metallo-beta-lactamase class B